MSTNETLGQFFAGRLKRSVIASIGLLTYAVGVYFQMQSDLGIQPWQALKQGLAAHFSISFGTASLLFSLVIIAIDLMLKERIGIGTFLDAFLVGIAKFKPREVVHKGLTDTVAALKRSLQVKQQ